MGRQRVLEVNVEGKEYTYFAQVDTASIQQLPLIDTNERNTILTKSRKRRRDRYRQHKMYSSLWETSRLNASIPTFHVSVVYFCLRDVP